MDTVFLAVAVTATIRLYICHRASVRKRSRRKGGVTLEAVGHVSSLNLFPVKSTRGIHLDRVQCSPTGVTTIDKKLHDR